MTVPQSLVPPPLANSNRQGIVSQRWKADLIAPKPVCFCIVLKLIPPACVYGLTGVTRRTPHSHQSVLGGNLSRNWTLFSW